MSQSDRLRSMTEVVADSGDIEAIARYWPVDATTDPTLLLRAASVPQYEELIAKSAERVRAFATQVRQEHWLAAIELETPTAERI